MLFLICFEYFHTTLKMSRYLNKYLLITLLETGLCFFFRYSFENLKLKYAKKKSWLLLVVVVLEE